MMTAGTTNTASACQVPLVTIKSYLNLASEIHCALLPWAPAYTQELRMVLDWGLWRDTLAGAGPSAEVA